MLLRLLGLPVTFPLWTIQKVMEEAEKDFYDERKILSALAQLTQMHDQGEISTDEYADNKAVLVDRLREARARQQQQRGDHG